MVAAYKRREQLRREADEVWDQLAKELEARIPPSMRKFALERGWVDTTVGGIRWWSFPEWLEHLVKNTSTGSCNRDKHDPEDLPGYGFRSFRGLKRGFADLSKAWRGYVRIEIDESEEGRVIVRYYASGFKSAWAIRLPVSKFLQSLEAEAGGEVETAMTFRTKKLAEQFLQDHPEIVNKGGLVWPVRIPSA